MTLLRDLTNLVNEFLNNPGPYRPALSAIKGFRNGAVYGAKIRAPHALVMTLLFRDGSLADKLRFVLRATLNHSRNLSLFVFVYKSIQALLRLTRDKKHPAHTFLGGFVAGYVVFHNKTSVSNQIILYLLSRIVVGLLNLSVKRGLITLPSHVNTFPWVSAVVWGIVMVLFEYERDTLQDSLVASMSYLYDDSESWTSLTNFIWHNK